MIMYMSLLDEVKSWTIVYKDGLPSMRFEYLKKTQSLVINYNSQTIIDSEINKRYEDIYVYI